MIRQHILPHLATSLAKAANVDVHTAGQALIDAEQKYDEELVVRTGMKTVRVNLGLLLRAERKLTGNKPNKRRNFRCETFDIIPVVIKEQFPEVKFVHARFCASGIHWGMSWRVHDMMLRERDHLHQKKGRVKRRSHETATT